MYRHFFAALLCGIIVVSCCHSGTSPDFKALNRQAAREYLEPVRPGYEGRNPFWNKYSRKFTYAPAFDFAPVEGAAGYRFELSDDNDGHWSFDAERPCEALSKVWNELPVGYIHLAVLAVDKGGAVLDTAGKRSFLRDYPFAGPYHAPAESYRTCALKAVLFTHNMLPIQSWKTSTEPDMAYHLNTYVCKMGGATIRNECLVAKMVPELREDALLIAHHVAEFLVSVSQPEGHPLAYFPPTYYKHYAASRWDWNQGKTMTMEPLFVADGFLDLYDATGEKEWFERTLNIARTYQRLQREDGTMPIKLFYETGEAVNDMTARLHPIVAFVTRLQDQYGVHEFDEMKAKAEKWMDEVALKDFDMTGQFEDVQVEDVEPYQNLTNCTSAPYASCLLRRHNRTERDVAEAHDLIRFCEDQFVHWGCLRGLYNGRMENEWTPCVHEQYRFDVSVDASAHNMIEAWLDYWEVTGDELILEKAKAMAASITNMQIHNTGQIPTLWTFRRENASCYWLNCAFATTLSLLRMADLQDNGII